MKYSPVPLRRHLLLAGSIGVIISFALLGFLILTNNATGHRDGVDERDQKQLDARTQLGKQVAEQTEELRTEQERLRAELEQNRIELERIKGAQARKEATEIADRELADARRRLVAIEKLERLYREAVDKGDLEAMTRCAELRVDPTDTNHPFMKGWAQKRAAFIEEKSGEQHALLNAVKKDTATALVALSDEKFPQDVNGTFKETVNAELTRVEGFVNRPYPDPTAHYKRAQAEVKASEERERQLKVEKSKKALDALDKYLATLPRLSGTELTQIEFQTVVATVNRIVLLNTEGKLTVKSAEEAMSKFHLQWRHQKFLGIFDTVVSLGGDYRPDHDPDKPSIAETRTKLLILINQAAEK